MVGRCLYAEPQGIVSCARSNHLTASLRCRTLSEKQQRRATPARKLSTATGVQELVREAAQIAQQHIQARDQHAMRTRPIQRS